MVVRLAPVRAVVTFRAVVIISFTKGDRQVVRLPTGREISLPPYTYTPFSFGKHWWPSCTVCHTEHLPFATSGHIPDFDPYRNCILYTLTSEANSPTVWMLQPYRVIQKKPGYRLLSTPPLRRQWGGWLTERTRGAKAEAVRRNPRGREADRRIGVHL